MQEKALLGEGTAGITSLDCLKPVAEPIKSDSFVSSTDRSTTPSRKMHSRAGISERSAEEFRHSAIQASDEDISNFTEVTLGHSWVLPPTIKSRTESPKTLNQNSLSTLSSSSATKQIPEMNFDDFEPFIMVPRSPDSKVKHYPNLKDFPMPSVGPPQGKKPKLEFSKSNKSPMKKSNPPIEFEGLSLKKTTLSRSEVQTVHKTGSSSRPATTESTHDSHEKPEVNLQKISKKPIKKKVEKEPTAPFFFPALLSSAPQINLAPVGYDIIQQENILLYENTNNF